MNSRIAGSNSALLLALILTALLLAAPTRTYAQRGGGQRAGQAPTAQAAAPIDITGYWVSLVTDDWTYRMLTPRKGDYQSISLSNEGRQIADSWDPSKDEASGNECKGYGAPAIMRLPTRLHITWENDSTLRIDTDTGTQTRQLHFGGSRPQGAEPTWQGYSAAEWQAAGRGGGGRAGQTRAGTLKVVTTNLRSGYLRKNGVPYSGDTVLSEYFNRITESNGDQYLILTVIVQDPRFLTQSTIRTSEFKMEPNGSKWSPTPCSAR